MSNRNVVSFDGFKRLNEEESKYSKFRRAMNGKRIAHWAFYLTDPMGNKRTYYVNVMYRETPRKDEIYYSEQLVSSWSGSGQPHALSNMQNKPTRLFSSEEAVGLGENDFNQAIDAFFDGKVKAEKWLSELNQEWLGSDVPEMVKDWLRSGVQRYNKHEFKIDI